MQCEPDTALALKRWLLEYGGYLHPNVVFQEDASGLSLIAQTDLPDDLCVASCPVTLAITPELSQAALEAVLQQLQENTFLSFWSERQLICTYVAFHWILGESRAPPNLAHFPYLQALPPAGKLRTPLYFTDAELDRFKGTNLYGATIDRRREWQAEWTKCREDVTIVDRSIGENYSWDYYLLASTYLSSRAFPSRVLSPTAASQADSDVSHPILLPGVDSFNHARAHPVSWILSQSDKKKERRDPSASSLASSSVSLVIHKLTPTGEEVFNNYGAKPNSELILGYGFSLPNNPDDTIVLRIAGWPNSDRQASKWEVGREAAGVHGLWQEILEFVVESVDDADSNAWDNDLEAADILSAMVQASLDKLPSRTNPNQLRPEVLTMLENYLEGQRDVLESMLLYAEDKRAEAVQAAKAQGVQIVFDD